MNAFLAVVFLFAGVSATVAQRSTAQELVSISVNPRSDYSKIGREKFVSLILSYCNEVLAATPTNTPAEQQWVSAELNTTDSGRIQRATSSVEYARYELRDTFSNCVDVASKITREQKARGAKDITRFEAAHLISLAAGFNSDHDILLYARRAGLNVDQFRLDFISAVRRALLFASLRALENQ